MAYDLFSVNRWEHFVSGFNGVHHGFAYEPCRIKSTHGEMLGLRCIKCGTEMAVFDGEQHPLDASRSSARAHSQLHLAVDLAKEQMLAGV